MFSYASYVLNEVEECDCHIQLLDFVFSNSYGVIPTQSVVFNRALYWAILGPIFWPAALYYLLVVRPSNERRYPPTRWQGLAGMFAVSSFGGMILGSILGPPDPFTQILYTPAFFAILLLITYLLVYRRRYGRLPEVA